MPDDANGNEQRFVCHLRGRLLALSNGGLDVTNKFR